MYKSCEVYRCFYNKDGCCLYDESPLQPVSIKFCYDYDEEDEEVIVRKVSK